MSNFNVTLFALGPPERLREVFGHPRLDRFNGTGLCREFDHDNNG